MNHGINNIKKEFVPEWAKKVVWYQIFPERFRNGDSNSDPTKDDLKGAWPHDYSSPWQIHPWGSDWYKLQPYEKKNGKGIWFNIQRRRYGGDLKGIFDKLDYLQDLGISAIYLTPVFESPSSHKYDSASYHHIDPNFGPDPDGDRIIIASEKPYISSSWKWTSADRFMLKLIKEIHKRKMYIILDGVFNHMGLNSPAFQDVMKNQPKSKYKNWFKIISWDNDKTCTKFDYTGWQGVKELPELNQDENGIAAGPKKYIFEITKRWMDPYNNGNTKAGIDGWRLDVASLIKHPFWKDWRRLVKTINPNAYITGEIIQPINSLKPYLNGDEFDAVMNYNFAFASAEFFVSENKNISVSSFDRKLNKLRKAFPGGVEYVQQNLFGSHDSNRLASHIVNRNLEVFRNWPKYFKISKATNREYLTRKPDKYEIKIQKLMVIFQMTFIGAPMIYYGDEAGMWGANDPCSRKPMIWNDINYENEVYRPDQTKKKKRDKVEFNKDLYNHYKKLIQIRNKNIALQLGSFNTLLTDDENNVYAFSRNYGNELVIIVLNNSKRLKKVLISNLNAESFEDQLNNETFKTANGDFKFNVKGKWGRVLVKIR